MISIDKGVLFRVFFGHWRCSSLNSPILKVNASEKGVLWEIAKYGKKEKVGHDLKMRRRDLISSTGLLA